MSLKVSCTYCVSGKPSWTEEREWPCKRCDKNIKGITEFVEHLENLHPNQCGIVCPICDKELPSKRRLKIHVVIHSDKKATCPHCGKAFSEAYKLRRHLKEVHENLKDHVCATCGKSFARADKLFQHELIHVSKSEQPVEWIPIVNHVQEEAKMSSSDTSSDSSEAEDDPGDLVQASLEEFLDTQIKVEEVKNETETKIEKLDIPDEDSDAEDIEWEDESELEDNVDHMDDITDEDGEEIDDDVDYVPVKKSPKIEKRKRGRPKKIDLEDELINDEWQTSYEFTCCICHVQVQGFQAVLKHMSTKHKDKTELDPPYRCILCPNTFARREQIKKHLQSHVLEANQDTTDKTDNWLDFEDELQHTEKAVTKKDSKTFR